MTRVKAAFLLPAMMCAACASAPAPICITDTAAPPAALLETCGNSSKVPTTQGELLAEFIEIWRLLGVCNAQIEGLRAFYGMSETKE